MHAQTLPAPADEEGLGQAVLLALGLHLLVAAVLVLAGWLQPAPRVLSVAGPMIEATLAVSPADQRRAEQAVREAPPPAPVESAPAPQPEPAPRPQDAPVPQQMQPQERIPVPDTVDQEAVSRQAIEREQAREREEQEARRRQEQIDLTERQKQEEAERRQRLREQIAALQKEREDAARRTRLEEQRLKQLAEAQATPAQPAEAPAQAPATSGTNGTDNDLQARYMAAMLRTAKGNWNTALAAERVRCEVRFTQIRGGDVIQVDFLRCPFDDLGRESVERALVRTPMPYEGFETVFSRQVTLTFCYPEEACTR